MSTNSDLDQARKWAEGDFDQAYIHAGPRAAAEVIQSLPDEWIDADKLREVIDGQLSSYPHGTVGHHVAEEIACKLQALFPTPQPRTLADMDDDEREACRWMKVDVYGVPCEMGVIIYLTEYHATVMWHDGTITTRDYKELTPLPDLPRMVWPDEQATEEDMSIIPPKIDTSTGHDDHVDMTPEDAPDGHYLVRWWGEERPVPAEKVQGQWWAIGRAGILPAKDVLIVSRLIPEVEA